MELKDIQLSFGERRVLEHFSMKLLPGSVTCLTGRSGCGKTTVLHLVLGLLRPDAGEITGFDNLKCAVVFQEDRLIEHLDAVENVLLVAARGTSRVQVLSSFDQLALDPGRIPVSRLSGGQRRRVEIVRAIFARPRLLVLDEPFKGLDADTMLLSADFIRTRTEGATVLLASHDREEALRLGAVHFIAMASQELKQTHGTEFAPAASK